jgi:hypothetical protein
MKDPQRFALVRMHKPAPDNAGQIPLLSSIAGFFR